MLMYLILSQINEQANPILAADPENKEWADWKANAEYEVDLREKTLKRQREDIDTESWGVPFQKRHKTAAVRDENMHWMHDVLSVVEVAVKRKMKELDVREKRLQDEEPASSSQRRARKGPAPTPQQPPSRRRLSRFPSPPPPAKPSASESMPSGTKKMAQQIKEWNNEKDREIPAPPALPKIPEEADDEAEDEAEEIAPAPEVTSAPDTGDGEDEEDEDFSGEEDVKPDDEDSEDDDEADDDDDDEPDDDEEPDSNETKASEQEWE
jgi:hypothetical protein